MIGGEGHSAVAPLGVANLSNFRGSYRAEMLSGGRIAVWVNGAPGEDGEWDGARVLLPATAIPDARDRGELAARLARSAAASGERALYHYKPIAGERHATPKIFDAGAIIANEIFYFSNPRHFEDRADCSLEWDLDLSYEEADAFYRWWVGQRLDGDALEMEVARHHAEDTIRTPRFEQLYRGRIEEGVDAARVLCLTTYPDNPFMWREYADDHTGVCFELGLPAVGDAPLSALPLVYRDNRKVKLSPDPEAMANALYFTKAKRFATEDEYRIVDVITQVEGQDSGFRRVDAVRGIIFGARIDPEHRDHLLRLVREFRPSMSVRQACIGEDGSVALATLEGLRALRRDASR